MKISDVFPSKYVKAADLEGRTVTLTIKRVAVEEMANHAGEKERKAVVYFEKATKGLVLNATNARAIAGLYGDETDHWMGKRVSIYPTRVKAFGAVHDCIRVREEIPAQPKPSQPQPAPAEEPGIDDVEDVVDNPFEQ